MAIPMVWGILAVVAVNITDTFFVGQLGTEPLAAMGFTFPVVMFVFSLGIGLSAGATSVIARGIGAGDPDRVRRLTTDSLILALIISTILAIAGLLTIDPVFRALGADDNVLPLIHEYMVWWYVGSPFLVVAMVGNGAIRAGGDTKWPGIIMVGSAVVNAVLDPILIFGLFGAPRMEIAGAAVATTISRIAMLVALVWILHYRESLIAWTKIAFRDFMTSIKPVLHVGGAAAINHMLNPLAQAALTAMVARYGVEAVAGYGVATRIEGLMLVILYAMSAVVGPIAGQNQTAGHGNRVAEVLRVTYIYGLVFAVIAGVLMWALADKIAPVFDPEPSVVIVAVLYLYIVPWSFAGHGVVMNATAWFNGLGLPGPSLKLTILRLIALMVPLAFIGSQLWGVAGAFAGVAAANAISGIIGYVWTNKLTSSLKEITQ